MINEINQMKNMLNKILQEQDQQSMQIQETRKDIQTIYHKIQEIQNDQNTIRKEMRDERLKQEDFNKLISGKMEMLEKTIKMARNVQIECYKDMIKKIENLDNA